MSLASVLPAPQREATPPSSPERDDAPTFREPPPYGRRAGWAPRTIEDFGDGGAFPEIIVSQYPLNMGRKVAHGTQAVVQMSADPEGNVAHEAVLGSRALVQARPQNVVPRAPGEIAPEELERPDEEAVEESTRKTRDALEAIVAGKVAASRPAQPAAARGEAQYIRYTPSQRGSGGSGAATRTIQLYEAPKDPLEPPKFKARKVPRGPPSPPVPVLHSPPRKLSQKDQQEWKIPPCVSNWKNNKGYTIALDKRLAADGRGLQEPTINDGFARLSEALYAAERKAREETQRRAEIMKRQAVKEQEAREVSLRRTAQEVLAQRTASAAEAQRAPDEDGGAGQEDAELTAREREERDQLREERRKDRERAHRLEAYKGKRDPHARGDRDFAEAAALGQAKGTGELMYDQRLFNQSQGMSAGFGDEDDYNVYSKPLFADGRSATLYRPKADGETYGGAEDVEKLAKTDRFRADRGFAGTERADSAPEPHSKPVEFEKHADEDAFGLERFMEGATRAKRDTLGVIGKSGTMHAAAASFSGRDSYEASSSGSGSKRRSVDFVGSSHDDERDAKRRR
eukprot:m51a1_g1667 hypothetical protein (571) ;mRNA; f:384643-386606